MAGDSSNVMSGLFGGLLDNFDPQSMGSLISAASFLKAAAPSMAPMNTAGRLGAALSDSMQGANNQNKLNQEQQLGLLDLASKKAALGQSMTKFDLIKQLIGPDGSDGSQQTSAGLGGQPGAMPTMPYPAAQRDMLSGMPPQMSAAMPMSGIPNASQGDSGQGGQSVAGNPRLRALLGLSMMDGKLDTSYNIMKDMQTGYARDAGKYYIDPVTGKTTYMMDPTKGLGLDAQGNVIVAPGFADANAAIKGSEATATKGAEARFSLLPQTYVNADGPNKGRPMGGSQFDYLFPNGASNSPSAPSAPSGFQGGPKVPPGIPADNLPGIQDRIRYAQNIADPTERKSFINAVLTGANSMPNPAQRKFFTDTFNNGIAGLSGQGGQQPQAPSASTQLGRGMPGQTPMLQSAEEARNVSDAQEVNKQRQIAQVNNQESSFKGYKDELLKSVDTGYDLYRRNNMVRDLMKTYQTGLPSAEARTSFASGLQNLFPGNDKVRSLAESINGGSVASAQTLAQVLSSATLKNLQEVLAGNGRINQAEVKQMQAHAESQTSDAGTLKNIMDYQDRFYNDSRKEVGALTKAEKDGTLNPATWRSDYIQSRHDNETSRANTPTAGQGITPSTKAVNALRMNPSKRADFDAFYGPGASTKYLGK